MFPRSRSLGFVFKKKESAEADVIFSVFSKDFGRIELLARGIRKMGAKLRSQIELFSISEVEFIEGKYHKVLVGATLKENFKKIKKNLKKLNFAFTLSEILDSMIRGPEKDERIFHFLVETFSRLSVTSKEEIVLLAFFWKLVAFLGYSLELNQCQRCQETPKRFYINFDRGSLICEKCQKDGKMSEGISASGVKILKLLKKESFDFLERLAIKKEVLDEILSLSFRYYQFLTENNENQNL